MSEIVGILGSTPLEVEADLERPSLAEVPVDDIRITHNAMRHILDSRNSSTRKFRIVELMRLSFMANGTDTSYHPPTDHMQNVFDNLKQWVGLEGSPNGEGNHARVEKLLVDPNDRTQDRYYLDKEYKELNKTYEWESNAQRLAKFDPYSYEPRFVVAAVRLVALESEELELDVGRDWLDFGK